MEALSSEQLPDTDGPWQYEPKWDGFRCLAFKVGNKVDLRAKSGKPLGRYFPEVVALLAEVAAPQFVLDGESVIELRARLAFDACRCVCIPRTAGSGSVEKAAVPKKLVLSPCTSDRDTAERWLTAAG